MRTNLVILEKNYFSGDCGIVSMFIYLRTCTRTVHLNMLSPLWSISVICNKFVATLLLPANMKVRYAGQKIHFCGCFVILTMCEMHTSLQMFIVVYVDCSELSGESTNCLEEY